MWSTNYATTVFGFFCLVQVFVLTVSQHISSHNGDFTKHLENIKFLNKETEISPKQAVDDGIDFGNSDTSDDLSDLTEEEKRALDRYSYSGSLGKRGLDRYSFYGGLGKRALDRYGFFGGLGKRALDRYGFAGSLGKRALHRYSFMGGLGKRKLDQYGFAGRLGKRALDRYGFVGTLGKRKLDQYSFMGNLGKRRLDSHRYLGSLGKRALDRYGFFGGLGKRADTLENSQENNQGPDKDEKFEQKRLYPYWYYRQGGSPIYTQTRGIDRFSFAARLGRR